MLLEGLKIGIALTGSFCTIGKVIPEIEKIVMEGAEVYPIISDSVDKYDTRFGRAEEWKNKLKIITGKEIMKTIVDVEPIGPKSYLDVLVIAPCTGNTLGKLANGITDTSVTMASKAQLRKGKPLVIAISTNDALGANGKNLGLLMNAKNVYMVPFGQDDANGKPNSLIANNTLIIPTIIEACKGRQIQPVLE